MLGGIEPPPAALEIPYGESEVAKAAGMLGCFRRPGGGRDG